MTRGGTHKGAPVGLVVEGDAEFHAFRRLSGRGLPPIKVINLGGVGGDSDAAAIARRAHKKVHELSLSGIKRIIVCVDRERRNDCPPSLAAAVRHHLLALLKDKPGATADLHVVIADRTFEHWILAGADSLVRAGKFSKRPAFKCFEGKLGRENALGGKELALLMGGRAYHKTTDGPDLFCAMDLSAARDSGPGRRGSRSLDKLLRSLGA